MRQQTSQNKNFCSSERSQRYFMQSPSKAGFDIANDVLKIWNCVERSDRSKSRWKPQKRSSSVSWVDETLKALQHTQPIYK